MKETLLEATSRDSMESSPLRLLGLAVTVYFAEQVDIADQLLCRILHLIFQLLLLCRTRPSSESSPYRSKIDGRVVRPDHRQGMGHDGDSGILVGALEVLPCHLALVDDGVRMW